MDRVCEPPKTQEYFLMAMCNALHREWQKIITGHQQWMTLYPDFLFTLNDTKEWKLKDYHWYPFFLEKLTLLGVTDNKYFERGRIQYESLI
jgi:hypothetical protein